LRVGEGGEQQPLVAALARDVAERERRREPRIAIALREAPVDHRLAVAAAQVGNLVFVKVLAREIGHEIEQRALLAAQVLAEIQRPGVVGGESGLQRECASRPAIHVVIGRGEIEDVLG
jgi:hypothetical protein